MKKVERANKSPTPSSTDGPWAYDESRNALDLLVEESSKQLTLVGGKHGLSALWHLMQAFANSDEIVDDEHWDKVKSKTYGLTIVMDDRPFAPDKSRLLGAAARAEARIAVNIRNEPDVWFVIGNRGKPKKIMRPLTVVIIMNKNGSAYLASSLAFLLEKTNGSGPSRKFTLDPKVVDSPITFALALDLTLDQEE